MVNCGKQVGGAHIEADLKATLEHKRPGLGVVAYSVRRANVF